MFSGAIFVIIAGILRCVLILLAGPNGAEQAGSWAVRETFVAVVVSNMPILYSLLRGFFKSISDYYSKRFEVKYSDNVRMDERSGSIKPHRRSGRSRDNASAYPIVSSSSEHIIQGDSEDKPHWHQHTNSRGDPDGQPNRIVVATRMTVQSEPTAQALSRSTN